MTPDDPPGSPAPCAPAGGARRSRRPRSPPWWAFVVLATAVASVCAASAPLCPGVDTAPRPPYGPVDGPPEVATWTDLHALPDGCLTTLEAPAPLAVALAGRFTHAGSLDDIAARLGAVSTTVGLPYWSVTDREWTPLVSEAVALEGPDTVAGRRDFDAREVLGGDPLYFAQNDTRSWGMNVYRMRTLHASADRLVVETDNVSRIKLGPVTLFAPHAVTSTAFIRRFEGSTWGYYGLTVIRDGAFAAREKSLINRQAALYRFLSGQAPDGAPPLAP